VRGELGSKGGIRRYGLREKKGQKRERGGHWEGARTRERQRTSPGKKNSKGPLRKKK